MPKRVLLVDDEPALLELVKTTLDGDDRYVLVTARDGKEALAAARRETPDLVFLDIMMPDLDGFEVCKAIKASPATAHARVIMLSALTQAADREKAARAGADGYMTKPFSPTALLAKVEEILR